MLLAEALAGLRREGGTGEGGLAWFTDRNPLSALLGALPPEDRLALPDWQQHEMTGVGEDKDKTEQVVRAGGDGGQAAAAVIGWAPAAIWPTQTRNHRQFEKHPFALAGAQALRLAVSTPKACEI